MRGDIEIDEKVMRMISDLQKMKDNLKDEVPQGMYVTLILEDPKYHQFQMMQHGRVMFTDWTELNLDSGGTLIIIRKGVLIPLDKQFTNAKLNQDKKLLR